MRRLNRKMLTLKQRLALPNDKVRRFYVGHGMLIKVTPTDRSWMFRYKKPTTGKFTETVIGSVYLDYAEANNKMMDMRGLLAKGLDPVQEKRKQRAAGKTFAEVCEEWVNHHRSKWRSLRHVRILLGKHCQPLADVSVNKIDKPMIIDALSSLYKRHPHQALRALRMCRQVLDYAIAKEMRPEPNPARWRGHLEHIFPERPKTNNNHYPSLPFKDVPELMSRLSLREIKGTSPLALRFQILTASRPGETLGMQWKEVDLINRIWTLPPERTKQNRQHRVPLSEACMRILALQNEYRTNNFVFTGRSNREALNLKALRDLLRAMNIRVTPHGFRASFRNWAARARIDNARIDRDLAELSLGHSIKGKVEEAYWTEDAIDERRPIMDAWSAYCDGSAA